MSSFSAAEEPKQVVQTAQKFSRTIELKQELDYLLFLPKDYDAERADGWPMILFLHGAGERGNDLERVKVHGPPKQVESDPDFPFVLVSPQCPKNETWDVAELNGLLDEILSKHNIDTDRIYLTGLSMGGFGTWSLGISNPERFAAIAPICGGGERLSVVLAAGSRKDALKKLPVWAFHGGKDPVVPLAESESMIDAMKRVGAEDVKLTIYPEAGHDSWTKTYKDPEFYSWLLQQKR
ncbi:carboxylesterase family protein [Novipirellula aureliae]|nr:prolyl oligopeptidase family serine peptidase [Novipirellula aureliae]